MLLRKFWLDEVGATVSLETVLVATVGVLGVTAGVASLASAVNAELGDVSQAVRSFDQTYAVTGHQINGTIATGVPCAGGAVSTVAYQAGTNGSGFVQAPPNFQFQEFNRRLNLGEVNINADIGGITGAGVSGATGAQQQVLQPQFLQPQFVQPQATPAPNGTFAPNAVRPQTGTFQDFNQQSIERLRDVPLDESAFRPNAAGSRPAARSNRITSEECKPEQR